MQTEKLTLAQLSGYLAYGLKFVSGNGRSIGYMDADGCYTHKLNSRVSVSYNTFIRNYKPLVIPLDRLTEAQWIEVFKAGSQEFSDAFTVDVSVDWVTLDCCYDISTFHFRWKEFRISHRMPPFNQLAAFNKLHELHADLHGLIEKGLALNKLDYEK